MRPRALVMLLAVLLSVTATVTAAENEAVFEHPAAPAELTGLLGPTAARLKAAAVLRGPFTQKKILKELPQPLVSSGDFVALRGTGVAWHTRKPFDSEFVLTPQAAIQRSGAGKPVRIDATKQPGLKAVSQVFDALFALDLDTLSQRFELFGLPGTGAGDWTLGLKPREPALAQHIARIVVTGAAQPQRIVMEEAGGDRTEIEFGSSVAATAATDDDRKPFTE